MAVVRSAHLSLLVCVLVLIALVLFAGHASVQLSYSPQPVLLPTKTAVVYALPTFHEEVVSSFACMLKDMDYHVVAFIGNGYELGSTGWTWPFTQARKASSEKFYGRCVDEWVTLTSRTNLGSREPSIVVFTTYPMLVHGGGSDPIAFNIIRDLANRKSSASIVMITHRVHEMYHPLLLDISKLGIPSRHLYFLFLGEHTYSTALQQHHDLLRSNASIKSLTPFWEYSYTDDDWRAYLHHNPINLAFAFPVIPKHYIVTDDRHHYSNYYGKFISWYYSQSPKESSYLGSHHSKQSLVFSVQGGFGGKGAVRKDPSRVAKCIQELEKRVDKAMSLYMVGHLMGEVHTEQLQRGSVSLFSGLDSKSYYTVISQSDFLIPALVDPEYLSTKATSSIPAALIALVPIATTKQVLGLYPCLREQRIHAAIAHDEECAAIEAAAASTDAQREEAKKEIRACSALFWEKGKEILHKIATSKATEQWVGQSLPSNWQPSI